MKFKTITVGVAFRRPVVKEEITIRNLLKELMINSTEDYPNEKSWQSRELIELSTAIKVPDINTFLTTFKIFQYELSKPQILMHYVQNELKIGRAHV